VKNRAAVLTLNIWEQKIPKKGIGKGAYNDEAALLRHFINPHNHHFSFPAIIIAMAKSASAYR